RHGERTCDHHRMTRVFAAGALLVAGCIDTSEDRTIEAAPNDLGVTMLSITRSAGDGPRVFELHAFAGHEEVGFLQLTTGAIADLSQLPGSDNLGSQLVIGTRGTQQRSLSREKQHFTLTSRMVADATFLRLAEATKALAQEHIAMPAVSAMPNESAYYYGARSCGVNRLLTTPVAQQCCEQIGDDPEQWTGTV